MFNLEKEFLASDKKKLIPIQLLKTNYGFSSEDANDIERTIAESTLTKKTIDFIVPVDDSVVLFLVKIISDSGSEEISQIETAPPGKSSVKLTILEGNTYWVYVVSKNHVDGYIGKDLIVSPLSTETERLELSVESAEQSIDLSINDRMQISTNENDPTQWYNYQGHYTGPLIWNGPNESISGTGNSLLIARDILLEFKRYFESNGISEFVISNKNNVVGVYAVMCKIASFMKQFKEQIDTSTDNELAFIWEFLNSNFLPDSNGNQGYQYLDENYYNHIAGASSLADYIDYTDAGGWTNGIGYKVYVHTLRKLRDSVSLNLFVPKFDTDNEVYGTLDGLVVDKSKDNDSINQVIKYADGSESDTEFLGESIRKYVRDKHELLRPELTKHGIPIFERNQESATNWWNQIGPIAEQYHENVWPWIISTLNDVTFALLENRNLSDGNPQGVEIVLVDSGYRVLLNNMRSNVNGFIASGPYSPDTPTGDIVSELLEAFPLNSTIQIGNEKMEILGAGTSGIRMPVENYGTLTVRRGISGTTISSHAVGSIVNKVTVTESEEEQETHEGTGLVAHEATLQNIRYVKNSVKDIQENIWTTLVNGNAMIFKLVKDLETTISTQNTKVNSLTNITTADVKGSDIEIVYASDLSNPGGWKRLTTSVVDISSCVKAINLNTVDFSVVGDYALVVQPAKIEVDVVEANGDIIRATRDDELLDNYQQKNAFYGWNIQFMTPEGNQLGEQRLITGSLWGITGQRMQISPTIEGKIDFDENVRAVIWSNAFIPVLVHVKIVDQNALTLSYSQYGKKEFNTATGKCTIYDYAGNIYKEFSIGRKATDETDRDIVEFREPIE